MIVVVVAAFSLVTRLYFSFSCLALNINELEMMGGSKKGNDRRERKRYAKSRDPHTFL